MLRCCIVSIFLVTAVTSLAQMRAWTSPDGERTVRGEFVSRDATSVTIRDVNRKSIVIPLGNLREDESAWLEKFHPNKAGASVKTKGGSANKTAPVPAVPSATAVKSTDAVAGTGVFDTLEFGDTREQALEKLKVSKVVAMTTKETFIGRSGLNGIFRTRQQIGDLDAALYFDWTTEGGLRELTLQTDGVPESEYLPRLQPAWKEFIELIGALYGRSAHQGPFPGVQSVTEGSFTPSHLWELEGGGQALLGIAKDRSDFQLVLRFTQSATQKAIER